MGDKRRFEVVADFVARNFPVGRVLDVAGGTGRLSHELALRGFDCTVVDLRKSELPRRLRKTGRRRRVQFERIRRRFDPRMAAGYDLIVGLHPDGATRAVAECAVRGWPVVLVPCCNHWPVDDPCYDPDVCQAVRRLWGYGAVDWWETRLPMAGKNLVMVSGGMSKG